MSKTIIITGGGTGGHLSVAKSFIEEFHKRDYRIIFIGSTKGQDKDWFQNEPKLFRTFFLNTKGVVNQNFYGKLDSMWMIFKAVLKSRDIIKKYNVSKVISVGGFSAASTSFASFFTKTDFYIHEQNSIIGKLNKITSVWAKEVFSSYLENSKVKDYPINTKFFQNSRVRDEVKSIIFLGGSQGARGINSFALKLAPILKERNINIIHQTGKIEYEHLKKDYKDLDIDVDIFDFSKDILSKMNQADFAVSRAGASTLWELVALGIPTFFIPYPYAAANHQYFNAKYLLENNLCFLQEEKDLDVEYFLDCIEQDIKSISKKLLNSIQDNAILNIVDVIEDN